MEVYCRDVTSKQWMQSGEVEVGIGEKVGETRYNNKTKKQQRRGWEDESSMYKHVRVKAARANDGRDKKEVLV